MRGVALEGLAARAVFEHPEVGPYEVDMALSAGGMPDPWIEVPMVATRLWIRAPYEPQLLWARVDPATGRTIARWRHFGEEVRAEYGLALPSAPPAPGVWRIGFGPVAIDIEVSRWH